MQNIRIRLATQADNTLPWVDYSTLTAINMCPRWGMINSFLGKRPRLSATRNTALEAGKAMHDVFAAIRMFELYHAQPSLIVLKDHELFHLHGKALFTSERWGEFCEIMLRKDDYKTVLTQAALYMLETSGYHDDFEDKKRTMRNLEDCVIVYIERYPFKRFIPVYKPEVGFIGVEPSFNIVIEEMVMDQPIPRIRFVGKIDAVCLDTSTQHERIAVHENKTGSRIDRVWSDSFTVNHQVTGYILASRLLLNKPNIDEAQIWGLQIPIPARSIYSEGVSRIPVMRDHSSIAEWYRWVMNTAQVIEANVGEPWNAPMYTHSCSRYFSSCPMIPFCADDEESRRHVFNNEYVDQRWNPLEDK
jgi:hypothetical protein